MYAIIVLDHSKSHGLALRSKAKSDGYPNGLAWEFMSKTKKENKPLRCKHCNWIGGGAGQTPIERQKGFLQQGGQSDGQILGHKYWSQVVYAHGMQDPGSFVCVVDTWKA